MLDKAADANDALLEVSDLKKLFPVKRGLLNRAVRHVHAVDGVSFTVRRGETLGLVGESGCGKSTTGRSVLRLTDPSSGRVILDGEDITKLGSEALRRKRRDMQMVFQDPFASVNPRMTCGEIIAEPLKNFGAKDSAHIDAKLRWLIERVGLRPDHLARYPHELSGGQRQRIGIARALALEPKLIVCDEAVSALDVSVQAQVVNLLADLQRELGLSYLFISHDLAVVGHISHRIAVMYLGRIVEIAERPRLFAAPRHPYTEALLAAVPKPEPKHHAARAPLGGDVPNPVNPPKGCVFSTRCPIAEARCHVEAPALKQSGAGHLTACHLR